MSYNQYRKRVRGVYEPGAKQPFALSRTRVELFVECPRCFWLDRRMGLDRPSGYPFTLNAAVDHLLKKEFDIHRAKGEKHPLMKKYGIPAVPYQHEHLDQWRDTFQGIRFLHRATNLEVFGAVDDLWVSDSGDLHVVDYKATAKDTEVGIDAEWQDGYKRQMEIYQWLLRQNGFKVSDTGYFVYVNGRRDAKAFDARLEFDVQIIPYKGSDSWIEKTLLKIKETLDGDLPPVGPDCDYCAYRNEISKVEI